MVRISSTQFGKEVGRFQDVALREPVVVTRNGRDRTVMISAEEYERLLRNDRRAFGAKDLPEDLLAEVEAARMDRRHAALDDLIADWKP